VVVALLAPCCLYDPDERCDANQRLEGELCVCVEGSVLVDGVCQSCGPHETARGAECVCDPGYVRGPTGECATSALGEACAPGETPCAAGTFDTCIDDPGGAYCSSTGCTAQEDCPEPYACDTDATPSFCRRPPLGLGEPCASSADCAGFEAAYCELIQSHTCQVADCASDDDCFVGWGCCDLTPFSLPTMCVPDGSCPL
jgi:hypothetical protein